MTEPNAASVGLIEGDKVLLIKRAFEPLAGLWTLPGGRREPGESIEETAAREVREELRLEVFGLKPLLVMAVGGGTSFRLQVFATEGFEGEIVASSEVADYRWLALRQVAGLAMTPGLPGVLESAFALFDRS